MNLLLIFLDILFMCFPFLKAKPNPTIQISQENAILFKKSIFNIILIFRLENGELLKFYSLYFFKKNWQEDDKGILFYQDNLLIDFKL